jgi:outer membrane receptor for ferrienterochelin and colicins
MPLVLLLVCLISLAQVQQPSTGTLRIQVMSHSAPLPGATVSAGSAKGVTSEIGEVTLALAAGEQTVTIEKEKFLPHTVKVTIAVGTTSQLIVNLVPAPVVTEDVIVTATRSEKRLQDEPLRVEVLGRDEIEEKLLMTPGDIAMMLNETAGLRVQVTSPSLGAASLRIQGLRGRYTQLLSDGLPLYGGQSGSIGLLQIPPMDLGQVEVIKGVASSLFGSSALGGVINLVSRQPSDETEHELLFNGTTQGGTDGMLWLSGPMHEHWGYTLLAGLDHQQRQDVDEDGWADLAGFTRVVARPRLFWNNKAGKSAFVTGGFTAEDRRGGTLPGRTVPDGSPFPEALDTRRADAGVVTRLLVGRRVLGIRGAFMHQSHTHEFGDAIERDTHRTAFAEVSLTGTSGAHTWVIGGAAQTDRYRSASVPAFDYTYVVPSLFAQDDITVTRALSLSISARLDDHNRFGVFLSPRLSALLRFGSGWTARASVGAGYFAATPLTEETEAVGLSKLRAADLSEAERARTFSVDLSRAFGPVELSATAFGSHVTETLAIRPSTVSSTGYDLVRLVGPVRVRGAEMLASVRHEDIAVVGTYTFVNATEPDVLTGIRVSTPLTPRHAAGLVTMWERKDVGRIGLEIYYTGRQVLDENPYRDRSEPYFYFGVLAERQFGRWRLFVNAENLTNRRQTKFDPLVRPTRNYDGRWTVDAWAPLEGRVANAGFRVRF